MKEVLAIDEDNHLGKVGRQRESPKINHPPGSPPKQTQRAGGNFSIPRPPRGPRTRSPERAGVHA
jgi:hypothetical protein